MSTLPPKPVVVRIISTGYFIPAVLVCLWWSRYGPEAWVAATQSTN